MILSEDALALSIQKLNKYYFDFVVLIICPPPPLHRPPPRLGLKEEHRNLRNKMREHSTICPKLVQQSFWLHCHSSWEQPSYEDQKNQISW